MKHKTEKNKGKLPSPIPEGQYRFHFPIPVFADQIVTPADSAEEIEQRLIDRNIYYQVFNRSEREELILRIKSLGAIREFLLRCIKKEIGLPPLSVSVYGSYPYILHDYLPNDIDICVAFRGKGFQYNLDQISIPSPERRQLRLPAKKVSFFFYGEKNLTEGLPADDTITVGVTHRNAIKDQLSVAYWRNIVIWGKDFNSINGNEKNALISMAQLLNGCRQRLSNYINKRGSESKEILFAKIVSRLIDINAFLNFFLPNRENKLEELFILPGQIQRKRTIPFEKIVELYRETCLIYNRTKKFINSPKINLIVFVWPLGPLR
ncbi:hypothetical protein FJZ40_01555 [Candidatus Shapirobacteria bacterium]|nr:hypothetical protein [Candidatus Shapirobacteria bacterium]